LEQILANDINILLLKLNIESIRSVKNGIREY